MKWVDSHAHLNDPAFDEDIDDVIERAKRGGIGWVVVPGYDIESSKKAIQLAHQFPDFIYAAVGWHPHDADQFNESDWEKMVSLFDEEKVVAVGETGLDFYKRYSKKEAQKTLFLKHIEAALEKDLPIIMHVRAAFPEIFSIISKYPRLKGVFHCFSGGEDEAMEGIKLGFFISFSGLITFSGKKLEDALVKVSKEKLLIETDAPYLAPVPHRGKRNEPYFLPFIGEKVAEILQISPDEVKEITAFNAETLFLRGRLL